MRKRMMVAVLSAIVMVLAALPAAAQDENVVTDLVITPAVSGGCIAQHAGSGSSLSIVVEIAVVTSGATSTSVTCHVTQGTRDGHVGAIGAVSAATGGGVLTGYSLASYDLCTEIHASFPTGPPYNKNCH